MKVFTLFLVSLFALGMLACNPATSSSESAREQSPVAEEPISDDSLIAQTTREILTLFKEKKYEQVGKYVHPDKGVRFSPYCYIDVKNDVVIHQSTFATRVKEKKAIDWGAFDGSGEPINLSFEQYVQDFIYDVDFLHAEETLINKSKGFSNTIDNREEVYKDKPFVCSYFSGFEEQYDGMDWRSLHLVYEIEDGKAWLIGIIHSEWTI